MNNCDTPSPTVDRFRFATQHLVSCWFQKQYFVRIPESLRGCVRALVIAFAAMSAPLPAFAEMSAFEAATLENGIELLGHNAGLADACGNGGRLGIVHDLAERVAAKLHPGVVAQISGARGATTKALSAKADAAYFAEVAQRCKAPDGVAATPLFDAIRQSLEQQLAD